MDNLKKEAKLDDDPYPKINKHYDVSSNNLLE